MTGEADECGHGLIRMRGGVPVLTDVQRCAQAGRRLPGRPRRVRSTSALAISISACSAAQEADDTSALPVQQGPRAGELAAPGEHLQPRRTPRTITFHGRAPALSQAATPL